MPQDHSPAAGPRGTVAPRPRSLIVTVYGLYARDSAGWISVSALIRLLAELDVDEAAVRSSVSRLKRRGVVEVERIDGAAGYTLSADARHVLESGDRRIFDRPVSRLEDGWVLAAFSVPESERHKRHLLRTRLGGLGFGTVGPGVWIAPSGLEDEARDTLVREQLDPYVHLFHSQYRGFRDVRSEVTAWWDLDALAEDYRAFDAAHAPVLAAWRQRRRKDDDGEAFADYVRALTSWRRLPFRDPGLAPELLPRDWPGVPAAATFAALRRRLGDPARRFVERVCR